MTAGIEKAGAPLFEAKVADTIQLPLIGPVVFVYPDNVPPQPVTDGNTLEEIHKPISGSTRECQL